MNKDILDKLNNGLGALAFFPPALPIVDWIDEQAKAKGKTFNEYCDELKEKHNEYHGRLYLEAEYAEGHGFNLEDYWQARLNGAALIESKKDIQKWLKR